MSEEYLELERSLRRMFGAISTLEDLDAQLGELTHEEQELLSDPSLYREPTREELETFGIDFVERVRKQTHQKLGPHPYESSVLFAGGLTLLSILRELEVDRLLRGDGDPDSTRKLADELVMLWTRMVNESQLCGVNVGGNKERNSSEPGN